MQLLALQDIESAIPDIAPRSRLVSLQPHGHGTSEVESLFSYLLRLAEAHSVRQVDLLQFVIAPLLWSDGRKTPASEIMGAIQSGLSAQCIKILEQLTGIHCLAEITLMPLIEKRCVRADRKQSREWCPLCLSEDKDPYERLLWQLHGVTHCARHKCELLSACPQCRLKQREDRLGSNIISCHYCHATLSPNVTSFPLDEKHPAIWRTSQIGLFLEWSNKQYLKMNDCAGQFRSNLLTISTRYGGLKPMGDELGLSNNTVFGWKSGKRMADLQALAVLAWGNGVGISDLFARRLDASEINPQKVNSSVRPRKYKHVPPNPKKLNLTGHDLVIDLRREISRNPYGKILLIDCSKRFGIDKKHIAFRDADFVKLLSAHNLKISRLKRRAMTWEAAIEMRRAILKTLTAGQTLTRRNISGHFKNVNWLLWPIARQVSKRIIALVKSGKNVVDPATRIPKDVKAFWSWRDH
ncbi:MAG: TniQ family protein [Opitutus sp.]|nr:TniQ family protein [Opitutus sp.]MCS6272766.1 TniQ family protein [Opitutus sp.]